MTHDPMPPPQFLTFDQARLDRLQERRLTYLGKLILALIVLPFFLAPLGLTAICLLWR